MGRAKRRVQRTIPGITKTPAKLKSRVYLRRCKKTAQTTLKGDKITPSYNGSKKRRRTKTKENEKTLM